MTGIIEALAAIKTATALVTSIAGLIEMAQNEGRDLTSEELATVVSRREGANESFEEELKRRRAQASA